ncbi:protein kinase [Nonomuraea rubra]|uniref:protein kinase domain-containing protein n=1 Tax=Nonomuraea rubra TaxID=46180 RepID=UPI003616A8AC
MHRAGGGRLAGRAAVHRDRVRRGPSLAKAGVHAGADLQRLAVATATALAAIHRAGVVHRDFKPANVLLGRDGPRVIDFGIARAMDDAVTRTSTIVGTPAYMAPEQFLGAPAGPAVDVFAWGSVMVYAATGAPPFGNDSLPAVLRRIQYEEPRLEGVPEPLRSIVHACLAKDPATRPAMQDVLFRLIGAPAPNGPSQPLEAGGPGQAPAPGGAARGGGFATEATREPPAWNGGSPVSHARTGPVRGTSRDRLITGLLAGGTAVVVTGGAATAWFLLPASPNPAPAPPRSPPRTPPPPPLTRPARRRSRPSP